MMAPIFRQVSAVHAPLTSSRSYWHPCLIIVDSQKAVCTHESAHDGVVAGPDVGEDAAEEGRPGRVLQDRRQGGRQRRDQPLGERVICYDLLQGTCMQAKGGTSASSSTIIPHS